MVRALTLSFGILCIVISMGVINFWGGFTENDGYTSHAVEYENPASQSGIVDISESKVEDAESLADRASGYSMFFGAMSGFFDLLKYLTLPYGFLIENGVPAVIAMGIQTIFSAVEGFAIIQFWRGMPLEKPS